MNRQLEREEEYLEQQLDQGHITLKEFNEEMRELHMDYQAAAEQAAQEAYNDEMERW